MRSGRIGRVGRRCFTVWVYLRNQSKKGNSEEKPVCDYTDEPFLHFMLFHLVRTLLDSELWLCRKSTSSTVQHYIFRRERKSDHACVKACICNKVSHAHKRWIRVGRSSEPRRGLSEFSFEMYIQCEGLKWFFLLNSIFYRFCRHFVVGRKKNKKKFYGWDSASFF